MAKKKERSEKKIHQAILKFLKNKGWFAKSTHGNLYQSGFPDIFATHKTIGARWIEVKKPSRIGKKNCFEQSQLETFPQMCDNGTGVWVMVDDTEEEYRKLMKPYNWDECLK